VKFSGFEILDFQLGVKAGFYTIKLSNESDSETDKFLIKFRPDRSNLLEIISEKINLMADRRGCLESLLSHEYGNIYKFSEGDLRLYCLMFGKVAIIMGGGDLKHVRATQDSEILTAHVHLLDFIDKRISERISDGEIVITDNRITGNLIFKFEEEQNI